MTDDRFWMHCTLHGHHEHGDHAHCTELAAVITVSTVCPGLPEGTGEQLGLEAIHPEYPEW